MLSDPLTIKITGKDINTISATSFLAVVYNMVRVLKDIETAVAKDPNYSSRASALEWSISKTTMNSPLVMDIVPLAKTQKEEFQDDNGRQILVACEQGLRAVENDAITVPPYFREKTLVAASKIVRVLNDGVRSIEIFTPYTSPLKLTQKLAAHVEQIVSLIYVDFGTFEGRLASMSVHGRSKFSIEDEIYGYIPCYFKEELLDTLKDKMFSERVSVFGETKYSPSGRPLSIQVEYIERLRSRSELPQFADLEGINFTLLEGIDTDADLFDVARGTLHAE